MSGLTSLPPALGMNGTFSPLAMLPNPAAPKEYFVVGGAQVAENTEFPFAVALEDRGRFQICGGSIIHPEWIITAAHCLKTHNKMTSPPSDLQISYGSLANRAMDDHLVHVTRVIPHPAYGGSGTGNDIGLLKLARPIPMTPTSQVVSIGFGDYSEGDIMTIAGWGVVDPVTNRASRVLKKLDIPVASDRSCVSAVRRYKEKHLVCVGGQAGRGPCFGDSGGPLVRTSPALLENHAPTSWELIGLTSFGSDINGREPVCGAQNTRAYYTRVSAWVPWIKQITGLTDADLVAPTAGQAPSPAVVAPTVPTPTTPTTPTADIAEEATTIAPKKSPHHAKPHGRVRTKTRTRTRKRARKPIATPAADTATSAGSIDLPPLPTDVAIPIDDPVESPPTPSFNKEVPVETAAAAAPVAISPPIVVSHPHAPANGGSRTRTAFVHLSLRMLEALSSWIKEEWASVSVVDGTPSLHLTPEGVKAARSQSSLPEDMRIPRSDEIMAAVAAPIVPTPPTVPVAAVAAVAAPIVPTAPIATAAAPIVPVVPVVPAVAPAAVSIVPNIPAIVPSEEAPLEAGAPVASLLDNGTTRANSSAPAIDVAGLNATAMVADIPTANITDAALSGNAAVATSASEDTIEDLSQVPIPAMEAI